MMNVQQQDPQVYEAICLEEQRQHEGLELIPSENIVSPAVLQTMGTVLTNKYAEGYPKKRYYGGNQYIDIIEQLAIDRAKTLFNAQHANVQPHSGANANLAAYLAVLQPGDVALGLRLDHGGHLTHGHKVNVSGKMFHFVQYGVDAQGYIDMKQVRELALEHKPKLLVAGITAYSRQLDFKAFKAIADEVGAVLMADIAHIAGLVVTGLHPSPFPYCDIVTTTTHKTLRGPRGGLILCKQEFAQAIDKAVFPCLQGGPLEHIIAAKAVAFLEAMQPSFKVYQQQVIVNAQVLAQTLMEQGLDVVTQGTQNHMLLLDLQRLGVSGKQAEALLDSVGMYANKNTVPQDPGSAFNPSGLRIGTPSLTTRGMGQEEMKLIGLWIAQLLKDATNEVLQKEIKEKVKQLALKFKVFVS
ncbi:MAG: serine hydroxymethyltransferase [Candidatus Woesearchaeota archaeon]